MVLWMTFVFCMSTDVASSAHTGRILETILHWIDPTISSRAFERVHFVVRKMGHITEYAVLALLTLRALRILRPAPGARWSWPLAFLALGMSAAYGATDEFHQMFVPSRGPSVHDVLIDACGAAVGLTLAFLYRRRAAQLEPVESGSPRDGV